MTCDETDPVRWNGEPDGGAWRESHGNGPERRPADVEMPLADVAQPAVGEAADEALSELVEDPFLRTDAHGIVRRANEAAATLLGSSVTRLRGHPIFGYLEGEQRRALRVLFAGLPEAAGPHRLTLRLHLGGMRTVPVAATIAAVRDARGAVVGARLVLRPLAPDEPHDLRPVATVPMPGLRVPDVTRYFADFLNRATALLGASLDQEAMLRGLAALAVPALGDWCFVDLVEADGALRRIAVTRTALESAGLVTPLSTPPAADGDDPAAVAARTGETQLVTYVDAAWTTRVAGDHARRDALGRLRAHAWLAVPLLARGRILGVIGFAMAASRRSFTPIVVAVAEEFARRAALTADNAQLYRQAVHANEAKAAFLGTISHELRTPLTAIIGYAELLQDGLAGPLGDRQADFVRRIRESSDHLLHLVEEVLRHARLQASEEHADVTCVDVVQAAEAAMAVIAPLGRRKGLALYLDRPAAPLVVETDAVKLRQILVNLLGNAVKFTDRGEVRLRVLAPAASGEPLVLEVCDTGIGIPPALQPHVFDPFWQAEQTPTRARGGAGLGLSVVQQLARLLGGDVAVESEPGRGSTFRVSLPAGS